MKTLPLDPYEIASKYWAMRVDQRSFGQVAAELGLKRKGQKVGESKRIENLLSRLVRQWELEGKVRHMVSKEPFSSDYLPLLPELEDSIRRFFGLRDVVVVDTSSIQVTGDSAAYDDAIHRNLGNWTARVLASIIRRDDTLGTGSGRGPYFTAASVNLPPSSDFVPEAVVSLTGHMGVDVWHRHGLGIGGIPPRSLDADLIADMLAKGLRAKDLVQLRTKITVKNDKLTAELPRVKVALVGVGALTQGHRLVNHGASADLDDVSQLLSVLNQQVKQLESVPEGPGPFHHWVGDLNNELFVVQWSPPEVKPLSPGKRAKLVQLVNEINGKFTSAKWEDLNNISRRGAVVAVAGGLHKGAAVLDVLTQRRDSVTNRSRDEHGGENWYHSPISHLVCDISVATYLQNAIRRSS